MARVTAWLPSCAKPDASSSATSGTDSALPAPIGLAAGVIGGDSVSLTWHAVQSGGAVRYEVVRDGASVAFTESPSSVLGGLSCQTRYALHVIALNSTGARSPPSAELVVWTSACPSPADPPPTPRNLRQTGTAAGAIDVSWDAAPQTAHVVSYAVSVAGTSSGETSQTTRHIAGLDCSRTYDVTVAAIDLAGVRSAPGSIAATTSNCPPTVAADLLVAPGGRDAATCTQSAPCATLDRAYHVATSGQRIQLSAGSYPTQTILADPSKTAGDDVVIASASGSRASIESLTIQAQHLTIDSVDLRDSWSTDASANDVTFRNVTARAMFISSSNGISILGGSIGPAVDEHSQIAAWPLNTHASNILIDGVTFHDISRSSSTGHTECLQIGGGSSIVVRRSRFNGCDVFDLSIGEFNGSGPIQNLTVENNMFGSAHDGYYSLHLPDDSTSLGNILIRNNSATQAMYFGNSRSSANVVVVANVAPFTVNDCNTQIATYSHNVWSGVACGSSDVIALAGFVDPASVNLHLIPTSPAVDRGDPANSPSDDFDGDARPLGLAPDAGADETR